ncbi:sugar ABC transporter ATP-binding protein [Iodobacter fluviatilis]|uniref:Galactose/methyl galactoside import ATP-binding protein MglA n=1 Tax=Iodobacter fluviatilis TaxID=537 RepID=A0A377SSB4_9NEIS|nr:sugar ABC transporter ATP-binding protein [Iodobacter fluviatilis]TCU85630.1 monosaccharide ABC transporter ATP-binding protein (CUT2 family) [Iodobacter fluviatilis]STR44922.1 Galactose/methyl galactoside import ATP-binding protein MglA [Iodobacter fluviatilis]
MNEAAIQARGLTKAFDGNAVLKGIDFTLRQGEVHAIVGQNGAGKSTLMKLLNGYYQRDAGELSLFGQPVDFQSPRDAREAGIVMVYQDLSLVATMSVAENIFMGNWLGRGGLVDHRAMEQATLAVLEKMGIVLDPWQSVGELTMGQQQFIEIAKAISQNAKVLILDEPTASLSDKEIEKLFAVVNTLKSQGVSIIYITHYLRDIFKICDSVSVLRDGFLVRSSPVITTNIEELVADMLGHHRNANENWQRVAVDTEQTPLLELRNVVTSVLEDVSFKVYPGQVVGLAGLLGSGRTEILEAIFGLDAIESGQILLSGQSVNIKTPKDAIKLGINLVPEDRRSQGLVLDFSVADNMLMSLFDKLSSPLLLDEGRGRELVENLIKRLHIKTSGPDQVVRFLSGGNQQKVVIGKCMSTNARVMLLDDPTFGIDLSSKYEIMRIVNEYAAQGNAVIFVSSEYSEIASFCDSTYIVNKGRISGLIKEGQTEERLLAAVQ